MSRILSKIVEGLGVLRDSTCSLRECQKLVELLVHKTLGKMVGSESYAKLPPSDHMIVLQSCHVVLPP